MDILIPIFLCLSVTWKLENNANSTLCSLKYHLIYFCPFGHTYDSPDPHQQSDIYNKGNKKLPNFEQSNKIPF